MVIATYRLKHNPNEMWVLWDCMWPNTADCIKIGQPHKVVRYIKLCNTWHKTTGYPL